ncbi:ABC transporter ATP-binding protein [Aliicoccus persicus]|uniref:ABC-2 type transport system ATP-binding protein n=1 Tax=Aliicoccus persicus TaxID=930138 RepID=A0A662Z0K7_9STAP|nr:ATP-binding cassette domain-containing protein [Aliicoccus persicus]SEV82395.1 ABC-2 type transport system ATP-binding protein [Aliicoccus persicus]
MSDILIQVNQLTKTYNNKNSVSDANFSIRKGDIFGLIGKNGAGKSTLLKMIAGFIHPTAGDIRLFNHDVDSNHTYFERIGVLIEQPGLYPYYSGYRNLELIAISYGLKDKETHINKVLSQVGLEKDKDVKVKNYSMGMKQRLGIALALLGNPDILILDESINGLDPEGIVDIRHLIMELNKSGMTIIIASHILEELSKIATRYAVINQGEILEILSRDELLETCEERIELEVDDIKQVLPVLEQYLDVQTYKVMDSKSVHIFDTHVEVQQVIKLLSKNELSIHSITKHKQSLEQYFLERTGVESVGVSND